MDPFSSFEAPPLPPRNRGTKNYNDSDWGMHGHHLEPAPNVKRKDTHNKRNRTRDYHETAARNVRMNPPSQGRRAGNRGGGGVAQRTCVGRAALAMLSFIRDDDPSIMERLSSHER